MLKKESALEIPTVAACISKISETISRLPVKLYRKSDNKVTEITDDNRLRLLNGETGDTLNTVDMWRAAIEDYYLGRGAWIYINSDGVSVKSIHYVDSRSVSVLPNSDPIFKAFHIMVNGRRYFDFQFIRLLRKTRNGWDNITLQSENPTILSAAYNSLKLENSMNSSGGCKPGFLKAKNTLSREAMDILLDAYEGLYNNSDNTRKAYVLNNGMEFQEISSTAVELQMNENKKVNSIEICKLFGFPHTVIDGGATDDDNKKFTAAIISILNQIETALDENLLLEAEKEQGYYWAFDTKELTRGSMKERYDAYEVAIRNHILQPDEIRREEDYEPLGFNFISLGLGDVLLNPKTMEVFTPNTGQTSNLLTGEKRAAELRGWITKNGKHIFIGDDGGSGSGSSKGGKSAKRVDKTEKSAIIKTEEQKRLQEMIDNGDVSLQINPNIQNRHYQGTSEYKTFLADGVEKSYFTVPMSDLQQLLNKKAATGDVFIDNANVPREYLDFGKQIAYDTKLKRKTSFVKVHYSKTKTHLSPYTPQPKDKKRKGG